MKPQPINAEYWTLQDGSFYPNSSDAQPKILRCPVQVGDIFYVRETYYAYGHWVTQYNAKKGRDEWYFEDMTLASGRVYVYSANCIYAGSAQYTEAASLMGRTGQVGWYKRPSLFMPKAASRTRKRVTGIRVEHGRISEDDARAEGFESVDAFEKLWYSIYGDDKPWRWVYELGEVDK
jgi:hypothetical protein